MYHLTIIINDISLTPQRASATNLDGHTSASLSWSSIQKGHWTSLMFNISVCQINHKLSQQPMTTEPSSSVWDRDTMIVDIETKNEKCYLHRQLKALLVDRHLHSDVWEVVVNFRIRFWPHCRIIHGIFMVLSHRSKTVGCLTIDWTGARRNLTWVTNFRWAVSKRTDKKDERIRCHEGKVWPTTEIQKMMGSVTKRPNLAGLRSRANSSRRMLAPAVTKSTEALNTESNELKAKLTRWQRSAASSIERTK